MKIRVSYIREHNLVKVKIETSEDYQEDYQLEMISRNEFPQLVKMECYGIDGKSNFTYDITNMISMKKYFESKSLEYNHLKSFIKNLTKDLEVLKDYLLEPNYLILEPALIFWNVDKWCYLYLPQKKTTIEKSFHDLSEYFVGTIDYQEERAIRLAGFLHKETLVPNFSLEEIWQKSQEVIDRQTYTNNQIPMKSKENPEGFRVEKKIKYQPKEKGDIIKEKSGTFGKSPKKGLKSKERRSKGPWGNWDDLLLDTDF